MACDTLEVSMAAGRLYAVETCDLTSVTASRFDSAGSTVHQNKNRCSHLLNERY